MEQLTVFKGVLLRLPKTVKGQTQAAGGAFVGPMMGPVVWSLSEEIVHGLRVDRSLVVSDRLLRPTGHMGSDPLHMQLQFRRRRRFSDTAIERMRIFGQDRARQAG